MGSYDHRRCLPFHGVVYEGVGSVGSDGVGSDSHGHHRRTATAGMHGDLGRGSPLSKASNMDHEWMGWNGVKCDGMR